MEFRITRKLLFEILQEKSGNGRVDQKNHLLHFMLEKTEINEDEESFKVLQKDVSRFCSELFKRFDESSRLLDRFLFKNSEWLSKDFVTKATVDRQEATSSAGRPEINFSESSERTKRRKTESLRTDPENSAELLMYAAKMKQREEGNIDAAKLLSEMEISPGRPCKIRKAWDIASNKSSNGYTPEEALALFLEGDYTKHQYQLMRSGAKNLEVNIYPSYNKVLEAKTKCYPSSISITESIAEVKLQDLLDHTANRIGEVQAEVLTATEDPLSCNLILISKWGCDGSSGHSVYKQRAEEEGFTDSDIFFTSLVPLQLYFLNESAVKTILWQNPHPSSVRFCRPIRIQFKKETVEVSKNEKHWVESQIRDLKPTSTEVAGKQIEITHNLILTMVDGKVCNSITDTDSTQTCYICKATPKVMNNIEEISSRHVDISTFQFGLSTLHAWIRFFECILHISYRLTIKTWQVKGPEAKAVVAARKEEIKKQFREKLGLIVDQPKQGAGTTNDGNTARRFFLNSKVAADITGVDQNLIFRFRVILGAISSGYPVNIKAFEKYAKETAELYVELYPWYYMPASVHKILLHGKNIISAAMLPIGQMSEEAQEARNKHIKQYREHHSRKLSRQATLTDVFNRLLATSDPLISTMRNKFIQRQKKIPIPKEVLSLLSPQPAPIDVTLSESEEDYE